MGGPAAETLGFEQRGARGTVRVGAASDRDGQGTAGAHHRYAHPDYWAPFILMGSWL